MLATKTTKVISNVLQLENNNNNRCKSWIIINCYDKIQKSTICI